MGRFDELEGYLEFGMQTCAHWLSWRCGIKLSTAQDKVRVARALGGLPKISAAMERGEISYRKVRAISRFATVENESELLKLAEEGSVADVERAMHRVRVGQAEEELAQGKALHSSRYLSAYFEDHGRFIMRLEHSPEAGSVIHRALQAAMDEIRDEDRASCETGDYGARLADALTLMAERFLAGESGRSNGERHLIHVHVDQEVLRDPSAVGVSEIDGHAVPPATVERLCCDGTLVAVVEDAVGRPLAIGRKSRVIPTALRRALQVRDECCRFPGCSNSRFVDAHHIHHWVKGGETSLENLVSLFRWHHRFLHEYGYRVVREGYRLRFFRPDGVELGWAGMSALAS